MGTTLAEFYAVDVWDDDFYPYWQSAILRASKQADSTKPDYTYIASATQPCNAPSVKGATVILPRTDPLALTNGLDLCRIDAARFNKNAEKYTKKPEPFSTARSTVVAVCDDNARVFRMPTFKMDEKLLKQKEPSVEPMSQLFDYALTKAFPPDKAKDIIGGANPTVSDLSPDSPQVQELKAGRFDEGYWFGFKGVHPAIPAQVTTSFDPTIGSDSDLGKLRNVLARYKAPNDETIARTGSLIDCQGYKLKRFVAPIYRRIAVAAHIEGKVTLSLTVNRETGQVENVQVAAGHPLLQQSAVESAKQWQFETSQELPKKVTAVLDFSFNCGN